MQFKIDMVWVHEGFGSKSTELQDNTYKLTSTY